MVAELDGNLGDLAVLDGVVLGVVHEHDDARLDGKLALDTVLGVLGATEGARKTSEIWGSD